MPITTEGLAGTWSVTSIKTFQPLFCVSGCISDTTQCDCAGALSVNNVPLQKNSFRSCRVWVSTISGDVDNYVTLFSNGIWSSELDSLSSVGEDDRGVGIRLYAGDVFDFAILPTGLRGGAKGPNPCAYGLFEIDSGELTVSATGGYAVTSGGYL